MGKRLNLLYFSLSQQSKHSRDIAAMLRARKGQLDFAYIQQWVDRLGLTSIWGEFVDWFKMEG